MVAGIVLVALGLKTTLAHVDEPLHDSTAFALVGGLAAYLPGCRSFRWRNVGAPNRQRLVVAALLLALFPAAADDAIATLAIVTAVLCALIARGDHSPVPGTESATATTTCAASHRLHTWALFRRANAGNAEPRYCATMSDDAPSFSTNFFAPPGPRATRAQPTSVWRDAASFAEPSADGIGSTIARSAMPTPLIAVVGHIDEIG